MTQLPNYLRRRTIPSARILLIQQTLIKIQQSRTIQQTSHRIDVLIQQTNDRGEVSDGGGEKVGDTLLSGLEEEAAKIVALEEGGSVKCASSDITKVRTGKGVWRAGVATNLDNLWVFLRKDQDIGLFISGVSNQGERLTTAGMAPYGLDVGRLYQFKGIRSCPGSQTCAPSGPVTAKNDFKISRSRYP